VIEPPSFVVMREVTIESTIPVPWADASTAFWCKYPNKDLSHVKNAWVLNRYVDTNHKLHSKRLICIEQSVPTILKRFSHGLESYFAVETSLVDAKTQVMVLETSNITFSGQVAADEKCTYESCDGGTNTKYTWEFRCQSKIYIPFVSDRIEEALVLKAQTNASKGVEKMTALSEEIQLRRKQAVSPRFIRWMTKYPTESQVIIVPPLKRRYVYFGPRKPFSKSSYNPFSI